MLHAQAPAYSDSMVAEQVPDLPDIEEVVRAGLADLEKGLDSAALERARFELTITELLHRATVGAGPLVHREASMRGGGFFDAAENAITAGRIRTMGPADAPKWLEGVCWRPAMCVQSTSRDIDCANCGADYAENGNHEVQMITIDATGGSFTITFDTQTTAPIAFDATSAEVQTALELLGNVDAIFGGGDIVVTGDGPHVLTFGGKYLDTNVPQVITDATLLTGGGGTATAATTNQGGPVFPDHPDNQTATAFEVSLRDLNEALCSIPLTPDALRMVLGKHFGARLWAQATAAGLATPTPADGICVDAAVGVDILEHDTEFAGNGTLLVPRLLLRYLHNEDAVMWVNGKLQTIGGNRVITEGIPVEGPASGQLKMRMTGPVDYARTNVMSNSETQRHYAGNDLASVHTAFGLVRSDFCAAKEVCVNEPPGIVTTDESE